MRNHGNLSENYDHLNICVFDTCRALTEARLGSEYKQNMYHGAPSSLYIGIGTHSSLSNTTLHVKPFMFETYNLDLN